MSEDVPQYGDAKASLELVDISPDEGEGSTWIVNLWTSGNSEPLDTDWWKIVITVIVPRIADESVEAITKRAQPAACAAISSLPRA